MHCRSLHRVFLALKVRKHIRATNDNRVLPLVQEDCIVKVYGENAHTGLKYYHA